jgi:cytochrome c551/c552
MPKRLFRYVVFYPLVISLLLILLVGGVVWQKASKKDLEYLAELSETEGWGAVLVVVKTALWGIDEEQLPDPTYDRITVAGRGHTPWVIRGNLDGRPRMIKLALAPGIWAAYDTEQASLYQVWLGEVLFEGAAYNYRHGPQPSSQGQWYLRHQQPARWFVESAGTFLPAEVQYLGHRFEAAYATVALHYAVTAGQHRIEVLEYPELTQENGQQFFSRRFELVDNAGDPALYFELDSGERRQAIGTQQWPLLELAEIAGNEGSNRGRDAEASELERGELVISNSYCLGCHATSHRVTGPAWSEVAKRFRGMLQEEVVAALVDSVLRGSEGKWGKASMPPHPDLSKAEASDAVAYILSVEISEEELNPPINGNGKPFIASDDYNIRPRLESLHPSYTMENLAPDGFEPKVGGLDFRGDGKLLVASWDADGAVFLVDPSSAREERVKRIAQGLHEPLGLAVVDDRVFVLQKQELTELVDLDGDDIIDDYRAFSYDWPANSNFHSFAFGLVHKEDAFHFLLSICVLPGGASCPEQLPSHGKAIRVGMDGAASVFASGFRTPNGIALGPGGGLFVNDNEGDYLPSSKLIHVREGLFYGSRAVTSDENVADREETPPVVWLPQNEVGNSPTEPLLLVDGLYEGQMIHGDVYNGGIKRVAMEQVDGQWQGAVFHFSSGLLGAANRLKLDTDGAIVIGEIGSLPNWGEFGKAWHGLEKMVYRGNKAFEILNVSANSDGFTLELTQPLKATQELNADDLLVKQWFYHPNEQYGGPKYDERRLQPSSLELSADRRSVRAVIPGLKTGYVVYLRLDDRLRSESGDQWWTSEAWYTLNSIPAGPPAPREGGWVNLFDGSSLKGWRNYRGDENNVRKWTARDGVLELRQDESMGFARMAFSYLTGGGSTDLIYYLEKFRDFELSLEWKISRNGNSGIFYLVADERENSHLSGIEMQVLDNDGHSDGQIETHRAGDLYDLVAADPETVRPVGEWNEVRIKVQDNHIEHWLNGKKVVSIERGSPEWQQRVAASKFADRPGFGQYEEGFILLQDHLDPVWYRNIRIRRLD